MHNKKYGRRLINEYNLLDEVKNVRNIAVSLLISVSFVNISTLIFSILYPYETNAILSWNFNEINGEDNKLYIETASKALEKAFPDIDFANLEQNSKDVRFYSNPDIINSFLHKYDASGIYDDDRNTILYEKDEHNDTKNHEFIHMASSNGINTGFSYKDGYGKSLREGFTKLINREVNNDLSKHYLREQTWSKFICELIDPKLVAKYFFAADLDSLLNELRPLCNNPVDIEELISAMDERGILANNNEYVEDNSEVSELDFKICKIFTQMYFNKLKSITKEQVEHPLFYPKVYNCKNLLSSMSYTSKDSENNEKFLKLFTELNDTLPIEVSSKIKSMFYFMNKEDSYFQVPNTAYYSGYKYSFFPQKNELFNISDDYLHLTTYYTEDQYIDYCNSLKPKIYIKK